MSSHPAGRHRAPSPLSPASSIASAISLTAAPATKTSAVIAISGAMVASLALPASAATETGAVKAAAPVALSLSPAVEVANPSAAQAPLVPETFGTIAFVGVVKAKPKPKAVAPKRAVVHRSDVTVSRSANRAPVSATSTHRTPAPAPRRHLSAPAPSTSGVLGIAASLAGIYYVYGGTTTRGFDCSGFTQYVFARRGISLPRTAEQQRQAVTSVANPRPGDLVFFGAPAYHVGIYAGNGAMWDSPRTGKAISLRAIWSSSVTYGRP